MGCILTVKIQMVICITILNNEHTEQRKNREDEKQKSPHRRLRSRLRTVIHGMDFGLFFFYGTSV